MAAGAGSRWWRLASRVWDAVLFLGVIAVSTIEFAEWIDRPSRSGTGGNEARTWYDHRQAEPITIGRLPESTALQDAYSDSLHATQSPFRDCSTFSTVECCIVHHHYGLLSNAHLEANNREYVNQTAIRRTRMLFRTIAPNGRISGMDSPHSANERTAARLSSPSRLAPFPGRSIEKRSA